MPEYRACLAENRRHYSYHEFEAPNDETALATLRTNYEADTIEWQEGDGIGEADAVDPVLWLDRYAGPGKGQEGVADEIELRGWVYFGDLKRFAERVASLAKEGAYNDATETLNSVIQEAVAVLDGAKE